MTEQSGRRDEEAQGQSGQAKPDQAGPAQAGPAQPGPAQARPAQGRPAQGRPAQGRPAQGRAGQPRPARPRQDRPAPAMPGADLLSDFQRWLIRSSAKNMRKEIGGQVRKTFNGGKARSADVWDVATTEIPPEVGESPECQWCPICRAARQMRDSGPGLSGQLSGAGNLVASAVQDAFSVLDSVLAKAGGNVSRDRRDQGGPDWPGAGGGPASHASPASGEAPGSPVPPISVTTAPFVVPGDDSPETSQAPGVPASGGPASGGPAADAWSLATELAETEAAEDEGSGRSDRPE